MRPYIRPAAALLAATLALGASLAMAQAYPVKPVRMIAPFPPGGAPDLFARVISENLSGTLGQQVIVENRPGAGGNIATEAAMRSTPDGYTLYLAAHPPFTLNPILFGKAIYDPIKDFTPISLVGSQWFVLSVHPTVPARSVKELIDYARANPGKMSYASSGPGSPQHLGMEFFKQAAGLNIVHVPYKGASLFVADLVNGTVQVALASLTVAGQQIKAGKIVPLALTSKQRSNLMAGIPTVAESGLPDYEVTAWFAVMAPAGLQREIVNRINADVKTIMARTDVQNRLAQIGLDSQATSPEVLTDTIRNEMTRWGKVIREAKIKVD